MKSKKAKSKTSMVRIDTVIVDLVRDEVNAMTLKTTIGQFFGVAAKEKMGKSKSK